MFDMMTGLTANDKHNDDNDDKIMHYVLFLHCVVTILTKICRTHLVLQHLQHYLHTYLHTVI